MAFKDQRMIFTNLSPKQCKEDAKDVPTQALEYILWEGGDRVFLLLYLPQSPYGMENDQMSKNHGMN